MPGGSWALRNQLEGARRGGAGAGGQRRGPFVSRRSAPCPCPCPPGSAWHRERRREQSRRGGGVGWGGVCVCPFFWTPRYHPACFGADGGEPRPWRRRVSPAPTRTQVRGAPRGRLSAGVKLRVQGGGGNPFARAHAHAGFCTDVAIPHGARSVSRPCLVEVPPLI